MDIKKGAVPRGTLKVLEKELNVTNKTMERMVTAYRQLCDAGHGYFVNLAPKKVGRVGPKSKLTNAKKRTIIRKNKATKCRATICTLAANCEVTLHRNLHEMESNMVATWIKPKLTLDHRMKRLRFILSQKVPRSLKFKDQLNVIVLDESWFYLHRTRGFVRVFPGD